MKTKAIPFLLILLSFGALSCRAQNTTKLLAESIDQFSLNSENVGDRFVVRTWLPSSYNSSGKDYPVLLLLDGDYAFDPAHLLGSYLQLIDETSEFIIVSISYGIHFSNPLHEEKRHRDFIPPLDEQGIIKKVDTAYYKFIRDELLPIVDRKYRTNPSQRTLWTYSLSGSFGAWLSYYDPSLFQHYIFASGNLIQFGIIEKLFGGEVFNAGDASTKKVFLSYDQTEIPDPKVLEQGMALFAQPDSFPGYDIKFHLTESETHASSYFVSMPAGLRHIYGYKEK